MRKANLRGLFEKPKTKRVFVDTSCFLTLLDLQSPNVRHRTTAEAYEKFFSEWLLDWNCLVWINSLVIVEIINEIDRRVFVNNGPTRAGRVQGIRNEMAEHPGLYAKAWKAVDNQRKEISRPILDLITKSEVILCHNLPGDTALYSMTGRVAQDVQKLSHKGVSPADVFHCHFMNRHGLSVAVSQDKHFRHLPGITVHAFMDK